MGSGRREKAGGALDQRGCRVVGIGGSGAVAPDRAGPGGIGAEAADHMDVELRHDVAERRRR